MVAQVRLNRTAVFSAVNPLLLVEDCLAELNHLVDCLEANLEEVWAEPQEGFLVLQIQMEPSVVYQTQELKEIQMPLLML